LQLIGDPKAGKKTLAKAMLMEPWKVLTKMYVPHHSSLVHLRASGDSRRMLCRHMTASLPLPEDPSRPRIDFLVFFVDMTNAMSLSNLKTRLLKVDKDYFAQGRACIVATRGTDHEDAYEIRGEGCISSPHHSLLPSPAALSSRSQP
jgi:hypothetical protein